jgi:imidazole glycerol-phosphate synthase subunit HisH
MKLNVTIVDYGVGNVYSISNSLQSLNYAVRVSSKYEELKKADALILPGVGAFEVAMEHLQKNKLIEPLTQLVMQEQKPILGICLGMQLMATSSDENGFHKGLDWIEGQVKKLDVRAPLTVPHVGWNNITIQQNNALFSRVGNQADFYFDHSYHFQCAPEHRAATCSYGIEVTAAVTKNNIFGVQFHPEKSQVSGLKLFRGFLNGVQPKLATH